MRITAAIVGDLEKFMEQEIAAAENAVTMGLESAAVGLKQELRGQVRAAGLGDRLANSWRSEVYPSWTKSINAAALVWTKAPRIIEAFDTGVIIRAKGGRYLAIPTAAAGLKRGSGKYERLTPDRWKARTGLELRLVRRNRDQYLLVTDGSRINKRGWAVRNAGKKKTGETYSRLKNRVTAIIFILIPQARLRKVLDVQSAGAKWEARLPGLVLRNWVE